MNNSQLKCNEQLLTKMKLYCMKQKVVVIYSFYLFLMRNRTVSDLFDMNSSPKHNEINPWMSDKALAERHFDMNNICNEHQHRKMVNTTTLYKNKKYFRRHQHRKNNQNYYSTQRKENCSDLNQYQHQEFNRTGTTNLQILKKQVEYLENQKSRWQRFPQPDPLSEITPQNIGRPSVNDIKLQSINSFLREKHPSFIIEGFTNAFSTQSQFQANFSKVRPQTCQEKLMQKRMVRPIKQSKDKTGLPTHQTEQTLKLKKSEDLFKAIHSKIEIIAPFKKYFYSNRSQHKKQQRMLDIHSIQGHKIKKLTEYCQENSFISI